MKRNRLSIIAGAIACALGLTSCGLMGNPFGSGGNNPFAPNSNNYSDFHDGETPYIEGEFQDRTMWVGDTLHINVYTPGVHFESDNPSVAQINENGDLTAISTGKAFIYVSKEEYWGAEFRVMVYDPIPGIEGAQYLEFEFAEHLDGDGSHIERNEQSESAHGGRSIGGFHTGGREIITFNSDRSGTASMYFLMAWPGEIDLESSIRIDVNGIFLDLVGMRLPDTLDFFNFVPVHFDNVAINSGSNTLTVEAIGEGPNMDCVAVSNFDGHIEQIPAPEPLPRIDGDFYDRYLEVGQTEQIWCGVPGVSYSSSNPAVVDIRPHPYETESLEITAISEGEAVITISKEGYESRSFQVTVLPVQMNYIEGEFYDRELEIGGYEKIMCWTSDVAFSSSNPAVVTVRPLNDGTSNVEIKGISSGKATITASKEGYYDSTLEVTVIDPDVTIRGDFQDRTIAVGATEHINCWTAGVSYSSSDTAIATVSSEGDITGVSAGTVKITISKTGCDSVSFTLTVLGAVPEIEGAHYLEFEAAEFVNSMASPEETPLAHGGKSIGFFRDGAKAIIHFISDKADNVTLHFMLAWYTDMELGGKISIAVNGIALNLAGKTLKGGTGEFSYYEFRDIQFDNVAIVAGQNTIELETFTDGPNLDCVAITDTDASIVQVPAPQSLPRIEGNFYDRTMNIGDTSPIDCWTTGVNYSSSSPSVAYVQEGGLIVAVATGATTITISKEGYQDVSFNVTVLSNLPTIDITNSWNNRVIVGQTLTIGVSTEDVSYSISDESILKAVEYVSGTGLKVEGVSEGDAIVTFSKEGYQDASVQIRAYQIKDIVIESATDVHLTIGETHQIVSSTEGVMLRSDNPKIATVDTNGLVTALAAGTTQIIVNVSGNVEYETAYIYITVIPEGAYLEFESGFHHSDSGSWQSQDGTVLESPVEANAYAHGGLCVSHFDAGCKETLYFSATSAGRGDITILCASSGSGNFNQFAQVMLDNYRIYPSATLLECGDAVFQALVFNNIAFNEGANELSIKLKGGELKLDCAIVTSNDATIAQLHEKPETEIQIPEAINPSYEGYSQVAAYGFASPEPAANSLTDDSLKSVFNDFSVFEDIVCGVSGTNAMYRGYSNFEHFGLKAGTASKNGQFTLNLSKAVDRVVVTAIGWTQTDTLKVGDAARVTLAGKYNDPNVAPMDYVFDITPTTSVEFLIEKRCFIQSIRFYSSGAQPVVEENHDLPVVAQGNQPTKIEGAGAWIYLDNSKLGITTENAQSVIDASTFSLTVSATENSNDDARTFLETASFGITGLLFDDFNVENQTVRLFLAMNYGVSPEWCLEHTFHIKLVIGENTYEGDVRFVANEYIPNN